MATPQGVADSPLSTSSELHSTELRMGPISRSHPHPIKRPKLTPYVNDFRAASGANVPNFLLVVNERHLYGTMKHHQAYFNYARPHQGIDQRIQCPSEQLQQQNMGQIISHPVLGRLHHDYRRRTAGEPSLPGAA